MAEPASAFSTALLLQLQIMPGPFQKDGHHGGGGLKIFFAAAFTLCTEHSGPEQPALCLRESFRELGALSRQLQHRFCQSNGLFDGGAGHSDHQIAVLKNGLKGSASHLDRWCS